MKNLCLFLLLLIAFHVSFSAQDSSQKEDVLNARKTEKEKVKNREYCAKLTFQQGMSDNRCFEHYPTEIMTWGKGFSDGLAKITVNDKAGFINSNGEIVIKPTLKDAGEFKEGLAPFEDSSGKWGFIDKTGKVAIKPQFDWAMNFHEGLALVQLNNLWGYIDADGQIIIKPEYEVASSFSEGFAVVGYSLNKRWKENFIDKRGQIKFISAFDGITRNFNGGMALVSRVLGVQTFENREAVVSQSYFIDLNGKELWKWNSNLTWFSENSIVATVSYDKETKREKYSFLDRNGKRTTEKSFDYLSELSEGLAIASNEGKRGFVNKQGEFVINPTFDDCNSFSEGLAGAKEKYGKYGYIDISGKFIIDPQFDWVGEFHNGFALVAIGEKTGYINKNGKYIWKPTK